MIPRTILFGMAITGLTVSFLAAAEFDAGRELAIGLARERDHAPAALEFRRLALKGTQPDKRGGYYWLAGYEYMRNAEPERSNEMLDRAETENSDLILAGSLLRGENALRKRKPEEAAFYLETLIQTEGDISAYAARRLAVIHLRSGRAKAARQTLVDHEPDHATALAAIENYRTGRDKSPTIGGLLGMVPGLGHAYSGEYANGLRSLILNALFIAGMLDMAEEENWGAFAVISFFEITWYSGSIYGGIDAAHRYNRNRIEDCVSEIHDNAEYAPDWQLAPSVRLEFSF